MRTSTGSRPAGWTAARSSCWPPRARPSPTRGSPSESVAERAGAAIATAIGGVGSFEECVLQIERRGPERVSPFSIVQTLPNLAAGWVSIELGTRGPLVSECTACAASNMALGDGLDAIRLGRADVMFCGGTEAPITPVGLAGFGAMRALCRSETTIRRRPPARSTRAVTGS